MARFTDAEVERYAKEHDCFPEEVGFHVQDGLYFRRLDDGRVQISVVRYTPVRGFAMTRVPGDPQGRLVEVKASAKEVVFKVILTPESWASCMASVCRRGESAETWGEFLTAHQFHDLKGGEGIE